MKVLAYTVIIALTVALSYVSVLLSNHPFSTVNMAQAYRAGCLYGKKPLVQNDVNDCDTTSLTFKNTLHYLMEQD
jgi:hypothetical protein